MPGWELLSLFFIATATFAYIPGPAMLYATAQTIARGRRAGLMAALGIHVGGYLHVAAAAGGVAALFHAAPTVYSVIKLIGAAYLVWLGIQLFRRPAEASGEVAATGGKSGRRAFAESIAVEAFNPKTALFFLAFLPQFADPAAAWPLWLQVLTLGVIVNVMFSSADLVCVALASFLTRRLARSAAAVRILRMAGGAILIGLGAKLALAED